MDLKKHFQDVKQQLPDGKEKGHTCHWFNIVNQENEMISTNNIRRSRIVMGYLKRNGFGLPNPFHSHSETVLAITQLCGNPVSCDLVNKPDFFKEIAI